MSWVFQTVLMNADNTVLISKDVVLHYFVFRAEVEVMPSCHEQQIQFSTTAGDMDFTILFKISRSNKNYKKTQDYRQT